jgi:hypothetical protein
MGRSGDRAASDPRRAWLIVGLMVLFILINFADKAVIGLAAGPIIRDLHLTNEQFGQIGSAFFLFSISAGSVGGQPRFDQAGAGDDPDQSE